MVKRLVLVFRVVMIFHLFTASKESFQRHPIVLRIKPYIPSKDLNTVYYLALSSLACLISLHAPLHILQSSHTELLILKQSLLHLLEHANWSSIFLTVFAISYSLFSQIILPQFSDFLLEFFQEASHSSFWGWCALLVCPGALSYPYHKIICVCLLAYISHQKIRSSKIKTLSLLLSMIVPISYVVPCHAIDVESTLDDGQK